MTPKLPLIFLGMLYSLSAVADGYYPEATSQDQPWSVTASFGTGRYEHVDPRDRDSAQGRLALGNELMLTGDFALGLEVGVQSGNKMRLNIADETLAVLNWLPVHTTLGPMLDLLITAKSDPLGQSDLFAQFKGGLAYRHWELPQESMNGMSQIAGEVQAGIGYPITALASLNLIYQGIFSSDPDLRLNPQARSVQVSNIPSLHALLLGLSVNL